MQNISMLGGGLNTILCGFLLDSQIGASALFYIMAIFSATGCLFYVVGVSYRNKSPAKSS